MTKIALALLAIIVGYCGIDKLWKCFDYEAKRPIFPKVIWALTLILLAITIILSIGLIK